jgi:uncharacterized protein (TIGR02001 family)
VEREAAFLASEGEAFGRGTGGVFRRIPAPRKRWHHCCYPVGSSAKTYNTARTNLPSIRMKNKKLYPTTLCALALMATAAFAQTATTTTTTTTAAPAAAPAAPAAAAPAADAPPSLAIVFTPSFASSYMFRGQRLGGFSFQPAIEADYGSWAVGVWNNDPLADKVEGQSDPEFDFYGSYSYKVNDTLTIQPGWTLYMYPNAPTDQGFYKLTFEPNIAFNFTVGDFTLSPKFYYDVVLGGPTYEFNAKYPLKIKEINSEIDFLGTVGTYDLTTAVKDANPDVKAYGNYWLIGASMPFTVSKNGVLTIGFAYTQGSDAYFKQSGSPKATNTEAVGRGVGTIALAWTF